MLFNQTKILYLCGDLALTGGIEKYNSDFISAIELSGSKIKVIQRKAGGLRNKIIFSFQFINSILTYSPSHIVCAHLHFSPLALLAYKVFRINYSLSLYGIEAIEINNRVYKSALVEAKKIIVISQYTKKLINSQFNFLDNKYFMLISSVNEKVNNLFEDTSYLKKKYGFGDLPIVLTISRQSTTEEKGQHRVLISFKEVLKKFPNAKYVIAGPGSDNRVVEALDSLSNIKESVVNLGLVSDEQRTELYNLCDVFVLPSKNEGFGIVFIEALACGAQVIASNGYGCKEGLLNGALGSVVDPDDTEQLAYTINDALEKSKTRTLKDRWRIRNLTIEIYGYDTWCKKVLNFLVEIGSN